MTDRPGSRTAKQRTDHDRLLRYLDWRPGARPAGRPLDAIVVPAARRAQHLEGLIRLAATYGTTLVVLASHDCDIEQAAELVAGMPGSGRAVFAAVPLEPEHAPERLRLQTADPNLRKLSEGRESNLSVKRNVGLLLARLRGWRKIMFLDDDIFGVTTEHLARVAHHLDANRFAGLKTVTFPDNSVVCHANRLAGRKQGIFVSGAALGVNTSAPLEVFPDLYNEDWFAFAGEAESAGVAHVGDVCQLQFNPFEDPQRAVREEFGDLLAEGLYSLLNDGCALSRATEDYWERFIDERYLFVQDVRKQLEQTETHERVQAVRSLVATENQRSRIKPKDCTGFIDAWHADRATFAAVAARLPVVNDYGAAFAELGLTQWQEAQFGVARMPAMASASFREARR